MDAIRIQDGLPVILILVESPHELTTNQLLQEFVQRPDNHCVPMLEVVELQHSGSHQLMVFPHLLPFHRSPIRTFEEFVIFITQVCEVCISFLHLRIGTDSIQYLFSQGIQFMHQMNIAYGYGPVLLNAHPKLTLFKQLHNWSYHVRPVWKKPQRLAQPPTNQPRSELCRRSRTTVIPDAGTSPLLLGRPWLVPAIHPADCT